MSGVVTKPLIAVRNYLFRTLIMMLVGLVVGWVVMRSVMPHTEYGFMQAILGGTAGIITYDLVTYVINYFKAKYGGKDV